MADEQLDLLISIQTDLQAGNIDSATKKIEKVTTASKKAGTATSGAAVNTNELRASMAGADQAASGLSGGLNGMASAGAGVSASFAKAGLIMAAFGVGIKLGNAIRKQFIDPLIVATDTGTKLGETMRKARHEIEELNKTRLGSLRKAVADISTEITGVLAALDSASQLRQSKEAAFGGAKLAELEANLPDGPDKQRTLAEERFSQGKAGADAKERELNEKLLALNQQRSSLRARSRDLEALALSSTKELAAEANAEITAIAQQLQTLALAQDAVLSGVVVNAAALQQLGFERQSALQDAAKEEERLAQEAARKKLAIEKKALQEKQAAEKDAARQAITDAKELARATDAAAKEFEAERITKGDFRDIQKAERKKGNKLRETEFTEEGVAGTGTGFKAAKARDVELDKIAADAQRNADAAAATLQKLLGTHKSALKVMEKAIEDITAQTSDSAKKVEGLTTQNGVYRGQ